MSYPPFKEREVVSLFGNEQYHEPLIDTINNAAERAERTARERPMTDFGRELFTLFGGLNLALAKAHGGTE